MVLAVFDYPKAILHVDGDAFFASCAQALNPKLKGKPVVTGSERGIATAVSYEARAFGIKRGMRGSEIKQLCPECVFAASDYESYSLFSFKMFNIVRRYTPLVEEYSIDECFADLTGLRRSARASYEQLAAKIKHDLETEVGITFSVGLASSKVVAKIASGWSKPSGLVAIPGRQIHRYLEKFPLTEVWGIGPQTAAYLTKMGVKTTLEFVHKSESWVRRWLTKPHWEIWRELHGIAVYPIETVHQPARSIVRSRTFYPASADSHFLFAQLTQNIEVACAQLRRHRQAGKKAFFFLKTAEFSYRGGEVKLSVPTNIPTVLAGIVKPQFDRLVEPGRLYRATGVVITKLGSEDQEQLDLFGQGTVEGRWRNVFRATDALGQKYARLVEVATALPAKTQARPKGAANFRGKSPALPFLGTAG